MVTGNTEPCDVTALASGEPVAFLWRGKAYDIRTILVGPGDFWRVEASTGRAHAAGVYELERTEDRWTVRQCGD